MSWRWWLPAALLVALGGTGLAWVGERDDRVRAEGRAELADSIADVRRDSIAVLTLASLAADSVAAELRARAEAESAAATRARARADSVAAAAARERPALIDSVVTAARADSGAVRAALRPVTASYEAEIAVLRSALLQGAEREAGLNDALDAAWRRGDRFEAEAAALRGLVEAVESANRARRPGRSWVERNGERALVFGLGLVVGVVGREIGE